MLLPAQVDLYCMMDVLLLRSILKYFNHAFITDDYVYPKRLYPASEFVCYEGNVDTWM